MIRVVLACLSFSETLFFFLLIKYTSLSIIPYRTRHHASNNTKLHHCLDKMIYSKTNTGSKEQMTDVEYLSLLHILEHL